MGHTFWGCEIFFIEIHQFGEMGLYTVSVPTPKVLGRAFGRATRS